MRCFELKSLRAFRWAEAHNLFAAEGLSWSGLKFVTDCERAFRLERIAVEDGLTVTHSAGRLAPWTD
jgi:diacylglycerol kinase